MEDTIGNGCPLLLSMRRRLERRLAAHMVDDGAEVVKVSPTRLAGSGHEGACCPIAPRAMRAGGALRAGGILTLGNGYPLLLSMRRHRERRLVDELFPVRVGSGGHGGIWEDVCKPPCTIAPSNRVPNCESAALNSCASTSDVPPLP
jgi:hypothetical protein